LTVYDNTGTPRAWTGRASDLPAERTKGDAALFVMSTPLGLRLVYLEPIAASTVDRSRLGAVVVEHAIASAPAVPSSAGAEFAMVTALGPVSLRLPQPSAAPVA